jgi:CheY-like chemotaxis protein
MPGQDVLEVADCIKRNPDLAGAKLILLVSGTHMADIARCREMGIEAYVLKPIRQSALLNCIMSLFGGDKSAASSDAEAVAPTDRPLRILLAEDNPINQKLAQRMLEKRGHTVVVAPNGEEAVLLHGSWQFDAILMDVQMPRMDGMEATAKIREAEKDTLEHIPIVAMTAHAMKGDKERCLAAGMDDYVSKPVRAEEVLAALRRVLGMHGKSPSETDGDLNNTPPKMAGDLEQAA